MNGARTRAIALLTILPVVLALYASELALMLPVNRLAERFGYRNPALFDPITAARDLRKGGARVYPLTTEPLETIPPGAPPAPPLPLAGISHTPIVLCNETGTYLISNSDIHGFSNPDSVWVAPPRAALIGDSFAQGQCVSEDSTIASTLRKNFTVLNAGISGAGPIRELAILHEYVAPSRPPIVFWLFFEGNDLEDLIREKNQPIRAYLDPGFSQHLLTRQREVDELLRHVLDSVVADPPHRGRVPRLTDFVLLRRVRTVFGIRFRSPPRQPTADFTLLDQILTNANTTVTSWGGKLVLVYLPDRRRFVDVEKRTLGAHYSLSAIRSGTLGIASRHGITVIDMAAEFERRGNPRQNWVSSRGHYSSRGYAIVAEAIERMMRL
jgi:hypothetical protein